MEQTKNINVLTNPNITGNVGSCESKVITAETGNHFFYTTEKNIVTNSCTGQVTVYDTWSLGVAPFIILVGFIIWLLAKISD